MATSAEDSLCSPLDLALSALLCDKSINANDVSIVVDNARIPFDYTLATSLSVSNGIISSSSLPFTKDSTPHKSRRWETSSTVTEGNELVLPCRSPEKRTKSSKRIGLIPNEQRQLRDRAHAISIPALEISFPKSPPGRYFRKTISLPLSDSPREKCDTVHSSSKALEGGRRRNSTSRCPPTPPVRQKTSNLEEMRDRLQTLAITAPDMDSSADATNIASATGSNSALFHASVDAAAVDTELRSPAIYPCASSSPYSSKQFANLTSPTTITFFPDALRAPPITTACDTDSITISPPRAVVSPNLPTRQTLSQLIEDSLDLTRF